MRSQQATANSSCCLSAANRHWSPALSRECDDGREVGRGLGWKHIWGSVPLSALEFGQLHEENSHPSDEETVGRPPSLKCPYPLVANKGKAESKLTDSRPHSFSIDEGNTESSVVRRSLNLRPSLHELEASPAVSLRTLSRSGNSIKLSSTADFSAARCSRVTHRLVCTDAFGLRLQLLDLDLVLVERLAHARLGLVVVAKVFQCADGSP